MNMDGETPREVTQLLLKYEQGDEKAISQLLPLVYHELKRLAQSYMRKENSAHTLQATALVHEAYFRLVDQKNVQWQNRSHFFGIAAQVMRRILIDHARAKLADKRGGTATKIGFDEKLHVLMAEEDGPDVLALDQALTRLEELDPRQAKVVELRFFGGLNLEETAEVTGTSLATVKRDWTMAKAWLHRELTRGES
jgi:RNA polymerase sigma-70 factor (ECF subfamily)